MGGAMLLTTAVVACDSVEPGDYVVYRVSITEADLSSGCYWQYHGADANIREDSSTIRSSATFILYAGRNDNFLLDTGSVTLDGDFDGTYVEGDSYEFEGERIDVEWDTADGTGNKRTTTVRTSVDMTVDGALTFGKLKIYTGFGCTGPSCGEIPPSCTQTHKFVGTEIEDVQLDHQVGSSSSPPTNTTPPTANSSSGGSSSSSSSSGSSSSSSSGTNSCSSCSEFVSGEASSSLCSESASTFNQLMACGCSSACAQACGDNLCSNNGVSEYCDSCLWEVCYYEVDACLAD